ncbi:MAG: hypothetical protein ABFE13_11475 [Phycisphaerales bacterium]
MVTREILVAEIVNADAAAASLASGTPNHFIWTMRAEAFRLALSSFDRRDREAAEIVVEGYVHPGVLNPNLSGSFSEFTVYKRDCEYTLVPATARISRREVRS